MKTKTKTKTTTKKKWKWILAAPAPSPFEPEGPVYQVRHIRVQKTDGPSIRAGFAEVVAETVRLAPANLDASRSTVMFEWDSVYCTLTVTFTDGQNDARDVLKLLCKGWDREQRKKPPSIALDFAMERRTQDLRFLLYRLAGAAKPALKELLPKRKIRLRFKEHSGRREWTVART
jgi:hypothetical protein